MGTERIAAIARILHQQCQNLFTALLQERVTSTTIHNELVSVRTAWEERQAQMPPSDELEHLQEDLDDLRGDLRNISNDLEVEGGL